MSVTVSSLAEINAYLHEELPLTRAMGIEATEWDGESLTLTAPLAPNVNHVETAFGGSIASLGILVGYTLLHFALKERGIAAHVMIQKSTTDFLRPIDTVLTATARLPAGETLEEFVGALQKKRRGRVTVSSKVLSTHTEAAAHTGTYVAIRI